VAIVSSVFYSGNMPSDGCDAQEVGCRHESGGLGFRCGEAASRTSKQWRLSRGEAKAGVGV
jgi:hypothetical protein